MAAGCGRVELEREIDYMRESLSSARFVLEVVYPVPDAEENGPWVLNVVLKGPDDGGYYMPMRIRLLYPASYPSQPPKVKFLSHVSHMHLDEDNELPPLFYQQMHGEYELPNLMQNLYRFLSGPLHPCERCNNAWDHHTEFNKRRLDTIQAYSKLHKYPELFDAKAGWKGEWFAPELVAAARKNTPEAWAALFKEEVPGVYSFPMFTSEFCAMFLEEVEHYQESGLPIRRPNSMNNYGLIVNEIGMENVITALQTSYLQPICSYLFGEEGAQLDGHHSFMVAYQVDQDLGLDMHTDDSDVTFNVCLGKEFEGAGLQFCGTMGAADHRKSTHVYQHKKGTCVVHLGRKRHGADDITKGERRNLIIWNHNSVWRQSDRYKTPSYAKEEGAPDPQCLSYTHDRDYGKFKEYPKGREDFRGRGWCPPPKKEYDGFEPEDRIVINK